MISVELKQLYENLDFVSHRLSTQVRTIAVSVLALAWLFLVGGKDAPILPHPPSSRALLGIAVVCVCTLVADYLQYVFGYLAADAVRARAEAESKAEVSYDYRDFRYRMRKGLFWAKQVGALASVAWLFIVIGGALLG
jgi:hypothetical protein